MSINNIVLFIPSRIYGGAERQMALLALKALAAGHRVTVIDSPTGVVRNIIGEEVGVNHLIVGKEKVLVSDSIVITQLSYAFCVSAMLSLVNCDVRFWSMHPISLPHMMLAAKFGFIGELAARAGKTFYQKKLKEIEKSLYFQSDDARSSLNRFYSLQIQSDVTLTLAEPVKQHCAERNTRAFSSSIVWLGRLDMNSKRHTVGALMKEFAVVHATGSLDSITIVGDGPARDSLVQLSSVLGIQNVVTFAGAVAYEDLEKALGGHCLLVAHGTSVYEGVRFGIPTVVVDFYANKEAAEGISFRFYGRSNDLTLGRQIDTLVEAKGNHACTLGEVVATAMDVSERADLVKAQTDKMLSAVTLAEARCELLYRGPLRANSDRLAVVYLDTLFFALRNTLIGVRVLFFQLMRR